MGLEGFFVLKIIFGGYYDISIEKWNKGRGNIKNQRNA